MKLPVLCQHLYTFQWEGELEKVSQFLSESEILPNTHNERSKDFRILNLPELQELRAWFEDCLLEVCTEEEYDFDLAFTQSWFNRTTKGRWHHRHYHLNSFLSGIFYVTPSDSSTWMSTDSVWVSPDDSLPYFGDLVFKEVITKIKTEPGTLIVFPSRVHHSVDEHNLDEPRYSISFNTFPIGEFGNETGLTQLKLSAQ